MLPQRLSVDITSATVFRVIIIALGFWFVYVVLDIILMLFAAIIFSAALEPVVRYLQRYRLPRSVSAVIIYVAILLLLGGGITMLVQPLTSQITQLANAVPSLIATLDDVLVFLPHFNSEDVAASLQQSLLRLGENVTNVSVNVFEQTRSFFSGVFTVLFVFILAFYLLVEEDAIKKFARLVTPREHLPYVERSIERAQRGIGRWVLAQLTLAVLVGVVVGVGLWAIGVKYALVLALLAGMLEIIPVMGPIVATIPAVIVGLAQSWLVGVAVLGFYVLVQQLEGHILVPTIMRRAIGLNPLVTLIAILIGARLYGIPGTILAVPTATIVSIFLSDIFETSAIDDELAG